MSYSIECAGFEEVCSSYICVFCLGKYGTSNVIH